MFFQRLFAFLDKLISNCLGLSWSSFGNIDGGHYRSDFFSMDGPRMAIVGVDGKIHTLTGCWTIYHYYKKHKLVKRIPARTDLKPGERLATPKEIEVYYQQWEEEQKLPHIGMKT